MKQYLDLLQYILDNGEVKGDRTGTGTISVFGYQMRFDLREGFPLLTTKKVHFDSIVKELLWFIKGHTNTKTLDCKIWDAWADESGELGPIYGRQWREWDVYGASLGVSHPHLGSYYPLIGKVDQLTEAINTIKNNPNSRRIIVSAWNVADIPKMALPPCHCFFQFNVSGEYLDLQLYQRSADVAIGVPFNIASYALLLQMVALECNLKPRHFVHTFGDTHIYLNHVDGVKEQLARTPGVLPNMHIKKKPFFDIEFEDITLLNYVHDKFIKFPIAV